MKNGRVHFSEDVLRHHRSLRKGLIKYLFRSNILFILTAPVIYSMIIPAAILDLFCCVYQGICFPVYQIPMVVRGNYIRLDRHKLAYLNGVEKINCSLCGYFNGSIAFALEIASRTEQYWCPIQHQTPVVGAHKRYSRFTKYGDADSYHANLAEFRNDLRDETQEE